MKKLKKYLLKLLFLTTAILTLSINVYAHSGRTDANGGHKDNQNKSGLGSYHYHCGGHPAHLHTNGSCPYASKKSNSSSTQQNTSKPTTTTTTKPSTVQPTSIIINGNIQTLEVGQNTTVSATILPSNATNKTVTWSSSNNNIATVNSSGKIVAVNPGIVTIIATTSNGKVSSITITVKEQPKPENIIEDSTSQNNTSNNIASNDNSQNVVVIKDDETNVESEVDIKEEQDFNANKDDDLKNNDDIDKNEEENTTTSTEEDSGAAAVVILATCAGGVIGYRKYKDRKQNH